MKNKANNKQIGGDHYRKAEYQHWDFVSDAKLHYLVGCATKYIARWKDKNSVQDLEKALHYIDKAEERKVKPAKMKRYGHIERFVTQLGEVEARAVMHCTNASWDLARTNIEGLIEEARANAA